MEQRGTHRMTTHIFCCWTFLHQCFPECFFRQDTFRILFVLTGPQWESIPCELDSSYKMRTIFTLMSSTTYHEIRRLGPLPLQQAICNTANAYSEQERQLKESSCPWHCAHRTDTYRTINRLVLRTLHGVSCAPFKDVSVRFELYWRVSRALPNPMLFSLLHDHYLYSSAIFDQHVLWFRSRSSLLKFTCLAYLSGPQ